MRDIKFRFWNGNTMLSDHDGWREDIGINEALEASAEYGYKIMQYTGLQDKNGVEIYEGDVVQWFPELGCSQVRMGTLYEGDDCSRTGWIVDDCFIDDTCEVLGNIYQHPDLIKDDL